MLWPSVLEEKVRQKRSILSKGGIPERGDVLSNRKFRIITIEGARILLSQIEAGT